MDETESARLKEKVSGEMEMEPDQKEDAASDESRKKFDSEDDSVHFYATLAFIVVIIVIGVPMWWKTTEVYRVPLPYSEIESLDDVPIKAAIRIGLFTKSKERRDILLFELGKKFEHNFVFNLQLEELSIDPTIAETARTPAALETAILARYPMGLGDFALIEWGKLEDDVLVTSERTAFISESATSLKIYQVLSSWILQEYKLKAILGSKEMQTTKNRQLRLNTAPMQPHYEILISVLNPRPDIQKIHWNARVAAENYITPFLDGLSTIANFTVKTQWVYQVEMHNPQKQIPDESKLRRHYAIQEDALPHVITAFEKKLGNQISNDPAIHLVVYVPPCGLAPLRIYRKDGVRASTNNVEAFTSAKWGGIVLANPSEDAVAKCMENPSGKADIYISSQDVMPVLLYQLRKIFDLENNIPLLDCSIVPFNSIEPRLWEVDNFIRSNTIYRIHSATLTLQSLIQLLGGIDYIVINDQVGEAIKDAYERIGRAKQLLLDNRRLAEAAAEARRAYVSAERAFFDPSMLALLYFPSEQKYAIYIPLFLPIMIPVIFSFNSISKFLRKRFGRQGESKQKTE